MAKLKIGDIIEIKTTKGFAYAQYTHKQKQYGALLRVFGGLYKTRPDSFVEMVKNEPMFICFFPLSAAVNRNIVNIVGNVTVPLAAQAFPIFRAGFVDPSTRKVESWWLWDGETEWRIGELSDEQRRFPIRGVWNDTLLIERVESGYRSETNPW